MDSDEYLNVARDIIGKLEKENALLRQGLELGKLKFNAQYEEIARLTARVGELETQAAKDTKGGALQALMYLAEVERADKAEGESISLRAELGYTEESLKRVSAEVIQLKADKEAWHNAARENAKPPCSGACKDCEC
jgi:hypothetical protein